MIIRQTTTIVFEYPQDYVQEQEWCKTKEDRWIHKGTDTLGAVYENQISYSIGATADRKIENSSEKPNNCEYAENPSGDVWECGCFLDTYCEHQIYDRNPDGTINIVECGYEPKDEPQTVNCFSCTHSKKPNAVEPCKSCEDFNNYEPQTNKVVEKKSTPIRDYMVNGKVKDEQMERKGE